MTADREVFELVRLRDDPNEAPELREQIVREAAFRIDYDESKGLERLHAAIGAATPALAESVERTPARARRSWATAALRLVGLALLTAGVTVGLPWFGAEKAAAPTAVPGPTMAVNEEPSEQAPVPVIPTLAVESLPVASTAAPPSVARSASPSRVSPSSPVASSLATASSSASDPLEETLHLGELRRVATTDPQRALTMVEEGNRRFARGSFREERDAIAIAALMQARRHAEARRAGEAFLLMYPRSPLASKVRRTAGL